MAEKLAPQQMAAARQILEMTRQMIRKAADGDHEVESHLKRYVRIRLEHDERGKPIERKLLKLVKFAEQMGLCAACGKPMVLEEEPHLHRIIASGGYTAQNAILIHPSVRSSRTEIERL